MDTDLSGKMEEIAGKQDRKNEERMMLERATMGRDVTGMDTEQKISFAKQVQAVFRGQSERAIRIKANEALIEEQDNRGGYLVESEVAAAIFRIPASVRPV